MRRQRRRRLQATIESNVVSQPGGARMVYSEEITLAGAGRRRGRTSARWCARCRSPACRRRRSGSIPATPAVAAHARAAAGDQPPGVRHRPPACARSSCSTSSGWPRAAQPLPIARPRLAAAGPRCARCSPGCSIRRSAARRWLRATRRRRSSTAPGSDASALLLLAWLGVLLDWRPLRSAQTSDGGLRFDFAARRRQPRRRPPGPGRRPVRQQRHPGHRARRRRRRALRASGAPRSTRRCCRRRACRPSRSSWTRHSDAELCVAALGLARPRSAVRALPRATRASSGRSSPTPPVAGGRVGSQPTRTT